MATYDAYIDEEQRWVWVGQSPRYFNDAPLFHGDDVLYLRLEGCHGKHDIDLQLAPNGDPIPPFKAPHHKTNFDYNADRDPLVFTVPAAGTQPVKWQFTLTRGPISIDPELYVGTGLGL